MVFRECSNSLAIWRMDLPSRRALRSEWLRSRPDVSTSLTLREVNTPCGNVHGNGGGCGGALLRDQSLSQKANPIGIFQ
ncbi:hypothetical protein Sinac_4433 [Singulisphaera acidiphila DSM 18658]|uniref:Uncharacterized protein n=1 Tax=Singulisphaera acidiphila (strain ATCC BAA-1392 / DSM 18658 / VKM B-2454 / MOB10) TaxID=886293 RepID=L0DH88_SINAD|nr:hypothetical protein Sinac_4433 [Singulisphaera acidiphila DSM 18658]